MGRFIVRVWKFKIPVDTNVIIPFAGVLTIMLLTLLFGYHLEQTGFLPGAFRWAVIIAIGVFLFTVFVFAVKRHTKAQMLKQ